MNAAVCTIRIAAQLFAVAIIVAAMTLLAPNVNAHAAESVTEGPVDRTTAAKLQHQRLPSVSTRFCFTITGPGACIKFSRDDIDRFEAVGIVSGAVTAAAGAEYICSLVPRAGFKVACKGVIAGYYTQVVAVIRAAQEQNRCLEIKASPNPVASLIDRPYLVDC
jgi:hypothetical protein